MLMSFSAKAQNDTLAVDTASLHPITAIEAAEVSKMKIEAPQMPAKKWIPDVKKAMWMSIVFPGGGQIYNRKFWKLPIIYGGFVGCAYAYSWNNQMYQDYSQAYLDITDDDESTHSYDSFMHFGNQINDSNKARYTDLFRKRKDYFRRYRDMSFFCFIGVYALSIIDAYVDASLSEFDITDDLSLHLQPSYLGNGRDPLSKGGWGMQCSLNF